MKFFSASCFALLALGLPSLPLPAPAQTPKIDWLAVPGTNIASETNPNGAPALIGGNTIARNQDSINFDAAIESEYIRYAGNCRTLQLFRLRTGTFNAARNPIDQGVYYFGEVWFQANEYQLRLLNLACSVSRG